MFLVFTLTVCVCGLLSVMYVAYSAWSSVHHFWKIGHSFYALRSKVNVPVFHNVLKNLTYTYILHAFQKHNTYNGCVLHSDTGIYNRITRAIRLCKLCKYNLIENEYHFFLCFQAYKLLS